MRARDNPFASQHLERLPYRFVAGSWESLLARLAELGGRGALVGPEGSGKTTLLEQLARRLAESGREVAAIGATPEEGPQRGAMRAALANAGSGTWILVDAADALRPEEWRDLVRATRPLAGLVVTAHREGLLPTLYRTGTSPELLAALVRELDAATPQDDCSTLFRRHAGNLRSALRELYDRRSSLGESH